MVVQLLSCFIKMMCFTFQFCKVTGDLGGKYFKGAKQICFKAGRRIPHIGKQNKACSSSSLEDEDASGIINVRNNPTERKAA